MANFTELSKTNEAEPQHNMRVLILKEWKYILCLVFAILCGFTPSKSLEEIPRGLLAVVFMYGTILTSSKNPCQAFNSKVLWSFEIGNTALHFRPTLVELTG